MTVTKLKSTSKIVAGKKFFKILGVIALNKEIRIAKPLKIEMYIAKVNRMKRAESPLVFWMLENMRILNISRSAKRKEITTLRIKSFLLIRFFIIIYGNYCTFK
jgi:hypothetical protein